VLSGRVHPVRAAAYSAVTLNLFQGPSGGHAGAGVKSANLAVGLLKASTALAAKWILKQVQDDECDKGGVCSSYKFIR